MHSEEQEMRPVPAPLAPIDIDVHVLKDVTLLLPADGGGGGGSLDIRVSWDKAAAASGVDVDVGALMFGANGNFIDVVYHAKRDYANGAVSNGGEHPAQSEEVLRIVPAKLPATVHHVVPFVLAHSGHALNTITEGRVRTTIATSGQVLGEIDLTADAILPPFPSPSSPPLLHPAAHVGAVAPVTALLVGHVFRTSAGWHHQPQQVEQRGVHAHDALIQPAQEMLQHLAPNVKIQYGLEVVVLKKGESAALPSNLRNIVIGLGWDVAPNGGGNVDLDASCILVRSSQGHEFVYFGNKQSRCLHVKHSGDNVTGAGQGDDEQIVVGLAALGPDVTDLFVTVTSYRQHPISSIKSMFVRIVDQVTQRELMRYDVGRGDDVAPHQETGLVVCIVCKFARRPKDVTQWEMHAIGRPVAGATTCQQCVQHLG